MRILDTAAWPRDLLALVAPRRGGVTHAVELRSWEELRARVLAAPITSAPTHLGAAVREVDAYVQSERYPSLELSFEGSTVLAVRALDERELVLRGARLGRRFAWRAASRGKTSPSRSHGRSRSQAATTA